MTNIDDQDDDDFYDEQCDHENADIDMLRGRISCHCGYSKWMTSEEFKEELRLQAKANEEWDALCRQEEIANERSKT